MRPAPEGTDGDDVLMRSDKSNGRQAPNTDEAAACEIPSIMCDRCDFCKEKVYWIGKVILKELLVIIST